NHTGRSGRPALMRMRSRSAGLPSLSVSMMAATTARCAMSATPSAQMNEILGDHGEAMAQGKLVTENHRRRRVGIGVVELDDPDALPRAPLDSATRFFLPAGSFWIDDARESVAAMERIALDAARRERDAPA